MLCEKLGALYKVAKQLYSSEKCSILFEVIDVSENLSVQYSKHFNLYNIGIDQSIFDSLYDDKASQNRAVRNIGKLIKQDGLLLIMSSKWSQDLLTKILESHFVYTETLMSDDSSIFVFKKKIISEKTKLLLRKQPKMSLRDEQMFIAEQFRETIRVLGDELLGIQGYECRNCDVCIQISFLFSLLIKCHIHLG